MGDRLDVLVSGDEREPGELWRRVPPRVRAALVALVCAVVAAALVLVLRDDPAEPVPPPPLGTLGPASARVDDGGTLVRVEAELRTREPVVLRSGTVTGTDLVLLLDPVLTPTAETPDAVTSRIVGLLDPGCGTGRADDVAVLQVVVAPQDGGEPLTLRSDVAALAGARAGACTPVQASVALPPGSDDVARQLEVTVRLVDSGVPVEVLSLTGRGLRVALEATPLPEQVAAASGVRPVVTAVATVLVTDCSVEVLAPRRLTLEVQRGNDGFLVRVDPGPGVVAALDELVRQTCRRPRI